MQERDKLAHETIVSVSIDGGNRYDLGFGNEPGHRRRANEHAAYIAVNGLSVPCDEGQLLLPAHRIKAIKILTNEQALRDYQGLVDVAI